MLDNLLEIIGFPEELNFELKDEIENDCNSFDFAEYNLRSFDRLEFIQDWGYRADIHGRWVCLDINILKSKFDQVVDRLNDLLKSNNCDIIDLENFKSDNYYLSPTRCSCNDDLRIDFLNVNSSLSIQIVKLKL